MRPIQYDVFVNGKRFLTGDHDTASGAAEAQMATGHSVWLLRRGAFSRTL